jgi:hydrogenase expression/formation protein HypE
MDKIFISSSGIGKKIRKRESRAKNIKDKDKIIVTGTVGEHGISVMLSRKKLFDFDIKSDCQSLKHILTPLWEEFSTIRFMRDPTRGGVAGTLNEIYLSIGMGLRVFEEKIPLRKDTKAACEILGIDPYYLACEGRAVIVVDASTAGDVLKFLRQTCPEAEVIGEIDSKLKKVVMETVSGGERILDFSHSFNLPRIC